jgi:hypothetical protein
MKVLKSLLAPGAILLGLGGNSLPATAQSYRSVAVSRLVHGEQALQVGVEFVVGRFHLKPETRGQLYRAELLYDEHRFHPEVDYERADGRLSIRVTGDDFRAKLKGLKDSKQRLDLAVTPTVPLTLDLQFGAATAELDFGGLTLVQATIQTGASRTAVRFGTPNRTRCSSLEFEVGAAEFVVEGLGNARCEHVRFAAGAGEITLDFGGEWEPGTTSAVSIQIGLGKVRLRLPRTLGVTLELNRLLAGFDHAGFVKQGSRYISSDYEDADAHLRLSIEAVIGDIDVEWY